MNFEIFGRLVRIGMCAVTATEEQANAALARFFAAKGTAKPATDEEIVAALQQHIDTPPAVPAATAAPAAPAAPATPPAAPAAGATEDRSAQILAACRMSRLSSDAALSLAAELTADPTVTVATAMTRIQDRIAQEQTTTGPTHIRVEHTGRLQLQADAFDVLVARSGSAAGSRIWDRRAQEYREDWRPSASSRSIQGFSLLRLAEYCLCAEGYSASDLSRLNPLQLAQLAMGGRPEAIGFFASSDGPAYNTSGMFSNLLLDAANVSLRRSYDDARTTFQVWSRQGESLKDFKLTNKVIAGELSDPRAIPEDGEFEETTMADGKETYRLVVWGEIKSISWQAVVNDQLSAFTEIPKKMGNAMRRKQNRIVYDILKDNAALADSIALFHASAVGSGGHNNLTTGANPPAVATLNTMTQKMQEQRGLNTDGDGSAILNIMPRFLLGGPALRGTILELLGSTANPAKGGSAAGSSGVVNIWQNGLEPVIDGELGAVGGGSDVAYYLLADSNEIDTVEHAYLQGLEAPVIEQESAFDRLASRQRIYQAFAAKALDYRGMQKHAGA